MAISNEHARAYVRTEMLPAKAPPPGEIGARKWVWDIVFGSMATKKGAVT